MKISAIIPTFNEEDHIIAAIESLAWADEIIVVDSFSTDNTVALAQSKGVKILQRNYEYSASQKNWAIPQASYDWVFILDAKNDFGIINKLNIPFLVHKVMGSMIHGI